MSLRLSEGIYEEIHDYTEIIFAAYSNPLHPFVAILLPGLGSNSQETFEQGKRNEAERASARWKANPLEKWVKVVDIETGDIVSVSRWQIYDKNPFPDGPPHVEAVWLPEGSRIREYCTYIMNTRLQRQARCCPFPHVWLNMMATHPKHRRRGAASLMLQWGIDKADRMDYETFVEAADSTGGHVYRKFGFVQVDRYCIRRDEPKPDDEWKKLEETHSFTAEWMWRPKQGIFTEQSV